ncbi:MAG: adenylate/guanylate cyclase domain-containing protein [Gammaproteobacteria bacterium]|nr:adenylate/guanylate cyclase domain-containing protein [Gammaproteobacteria bacterium]
MLNPNLHTEADDSGFESSINRHQYLFRTLSCIAAAATLYTQMSVSADWLIIGYAIAMLIYPGVSYQILKLFGDKMRSSIAVFQAVDAALIGGALVLVDFSLLPTIMFVALIQFNSLVNGGGTKWRNDNLAFVAGIAMMSLLHQPVLEFSSDLAISKAALIGITSYFCIYALYMHDVVRKTKVNTEAVRQEQTALMQSNYKLSKYISPQIHQQIMSGRDVRLGTQRKKLTVFFSDLKDFSTLSEELEPEPLTDLLNTYLTEMSQIAQRYEGTIDKFIGDAVMVFFGDPETSGAKMDALKAVGMAIAMRKHLRNLQKQWRVQGVSKPLEMRVGINTGYCTVGNFGTESRMDYTVLGTEVNLASRLESAAKPGQILISSATYALVKDRVMCRKRGEIEVKGFTQPITVYDVLDWRKNLGSHKNFVEQYSDGFSLHMDLDELKAKDRGKAVQALEIALTQIKQKGDL